MKELDKPVMGGGGVNAFNCLVLYFTCKFIMQGNSKHLIIYLLNGLGHCKSIKCSSA